VCVSFFNSPSRGMLPFLAPKLLWLSFRCGGTFLLVTRRRGSFPRGFLFPFHAHLFPPSRKAEPVAAGGGYEPALSSSLPSHNRMETFSFILHTSRLNCRVL